MEQNNPASTPQTTVKSQIAETENLTGLTAEKTVEIPKPQIELTVSVNKMAAYIRVKPAFEGQEVTLEDIRSFLEEHGITYGIKKEAIEEFCKEKRFYSELECAEGLYPVHQEDAILEFKFNTVKDSKPKQLEDGTVDFRNLGLVQNVAKGTVLCQLVMPPEGRDGIDIYDNIVPYRQAQVPALPAGKNTEISEDGLSIVASVDGCAEYRNKLVEVDDVYMVKGDVDTSSGNIDFTGSVNIHGDVRESFSVKAGGDVSISGMAEGAYIQAEGNISISKGMNGMQKGTLKAAHDITGKYFENTTIKCGGTLYADVLMNCNVEAGSVILKGKKALLIGGSCKVSQMIYTNTIGSDNHIHTTVTISSPDLRAALAGQQDTEAKKEINNLLSTLQTAKQSVAEFQSQIQFFTAKSDKTDKDRAVIKLLLGKKAQCSAQVSLIEKNIEEKKKALEESKKSTTDFKVVAISRIFPGVKLTIGPFTLNLEEEYNNSKAYADNENIVFNPLSAADKIDNY